MPDYHNIYTSTNPDRDNLHKSKYGYVELPLQKIEMLLTK